VGGPPESVRVDQIPVNSVFDAWCALPAQMEASRRAAARKHRGIPSETAFAKTGNSSRLREVARA